MEKFQEFLEGIAKFVVFIVALSLLMRACESITNPGYHPAVEYEEEWFP